MFVLVKSFNTFGIRFVLYQSNGTNNNTETMKAIPVEDIKLFWIDSKTVEDKKWIPVSRESIKITKSKVGLLLKCKRDKSTKILNKVEILLTEPHIIRFRVRLYDKEKHMMIAHKVDINSLLKNLK